MKKVVVGVVEDEIIIADGIIDALQSLGYDTVGPAMNYSEALVMLEEDKPDILLLDIILSGKKDGIDLAWKIKEEYKMPFIFLTAHADKATVERAKQVDPPSYLVKPFNSDELYSAIEIALFNYSNKVVYNDLEQTRSAQENYLIDNSLFIKIDSSFKKIEFSKILYLKNDHVYINVVTADKTYLVRSNMSQYLSKFPANFFRVHRSYAINTEHLTSIGNTSVMIGDAEIPIASNYKQELLNKVNLG
jgi:two-component system, LytTR family, response regulator LytT